MVTSEKLTDVKEIIAFLAERFPKCFTVEGEAKPLKIGIFKDLAERVAEDDVVSRTQLRQALRRYTSSWRYLKCVSKGGLRIDLDGVEGAALEEDHMSHAAQALQESKAKFEKSRKNGKDKKFYKKSHNDTGAITSKQAKFNDSKQQVDNTPAKVAKGGDKKSAVKDAKVAKQAAKAAKPVELLPLSDDKRQQGTAVLVKFGNSPVPGVIKEVSKGDVHVQLNSGMVIKTKSENLFLA